MKEFKLIYHSNMVTMVNIANGYMVMIYMAIVFVFFNMVMMTCSQTLTLITSGNILLMLGKLKHLVDIVNIPTITSQRWLNSQMQYIDKFRHMSNPPKYHVVCSNITPKKMLIVVSNPNILFGWYNSQYSTILLGLIFQNKQKILDIPQTCPNVQ